MKALLVASALVIGTVGFASPSFAVMNGHPVEAFGPVVEMKMGTHMMHVQMIEDPSGGQWIVMSREEAEEMFGTKLDGPYMHVK
jgi:hypothetical protein